MKKVLLSTVFFISILLISCGGSAEGEGGESGPVDPPPTPQKPSKAVLEKPANNSECLEVDAVKFEWNASENTTSYTINIKNLLTSEIITNTITTTSLEITLTKGFPYSWQVISTNSTSFVAESDKWKFYLSGEALKNHAPFPAEILTPKPGSSVSSGSVSLSWSFSDIDANDTHSFDLYLDQDEDNPSTKKIVSNYSATKRTTSIDTPGVYYWRVVTKDNHGTSSDSGISTFTVLE